MKRGPKKKSPAYLLASKEFRESVLSRDEKCCLAEHIDHECIWPMDPAHFLTKQFLFTQARNRGLSEAQQLACVFDPRAGWKLCRGIHPNCTPDGFKHSVYLDWLPADSIDHATEWELDWRIEELYPRLDVNYEPAPPL